MYTKGFQNAFGKRADAVESAVFICSHLHSASTPLQRSRRPRRELLEGRHYRPEGLVCALVITLVGVQPARQHLVLLADGVVVAFEASGKAKGVERWCVAVLQYVLYGN